MRVQRVGESVDNFITDLFSLAEHCGFGNLHDELIRDRIVVGLSDKGLSEKLQLEAEMTLEKAMKRKFCSRILPPLAQVLTKLKPRRIQVTQNLDQAKKVINLTQI